MLTPQAARRRDRKFTAVAGFAPGNRFNQDEKHNNPRRETKMRNLFPRTFAAALALIAVTLVLDGIHVLARRASVPASMALPNVEVVASPSALQRPDRVVR